MKNGRFSAKVEKGGPYRVIRTGLILANQIARKPVRISCDIMKNTKEAFTFYCGTHQRSIHILLGTHQGLKVTFCS